MARVPLNQPAPEFSLADYTGKTISLSDFRGRRTSCLSSIAPLPDPTAARHMAQLRQDNEQICCRDVEVVVVGPEGAKAFADYFAKNDLPFIGLPDPKAGVLKLYGQEVNLFKLGRMPAQVLIDKAGVARYVHYGHSMSDIPPNDELLALAQELNTAAADAH